MKWNTDNRVNGSLSVCMICNLSQQKARSQVMQTEKEKCFFNVCRRCLSRNPQKDCLYVSSNLTKCGKKLRYHRMKPKDKEKIKNYLSFRFTQEYELRSNFEGNSLYKQFDSDMIHIIAGMKNEEPGPHLAVYEKQIAKLAELLREMNFRVEGLWDKQPRLVIKNTIETQDPKVDNGKVACGYQQNDHSKGIRQILSAFRCDLL